MKSLAFGAPSSHCRGNRPALRQAAATRTPIKWGVLLVVSLAFIVPLEMMRLPAALLLGSMAAAVLVAVFDGKLAVPHFPYVLAQGLIGCLVARSIGSAILTTMVQQWPLFLAGVCSVLLISTSNDALLVPLFASIALTCAHVITITLPPWLMAACYALVGWSIGLRFTREIVIYAARVFPTSAVSTLTLIALCGGLALLQHLIVGADPLTAYLATSAGGADSVAIIAASARTWI